MASKRTKTTDATDSKHDNTTALPPARWPRVLDVHSAAEYMGVSAWTIYAWRAAGWLPTVEFPATPAREGERPRDTLRRALFDLRNLDAHVDAHKSRKR
jgi:hypothetical protein